jgi:hypothetical protein
MKSVPNFDVSILGFTPAVGVNSRPRSNPLRIVRPSCALYNPIQFDRAPSRVV